MIAGLIIRSLAMIHAGANFSHDIRYNLKKDHKLVTTGIYRFVRHPSYLGFLMFAVGGQLVLRNVICATGFSLVLQRFFKLRIRVEEVALLQQYPKEFSEYRQRTFSGIPKVK